MVFGCDRQGGETIGQWRQKLVFIQRGPGFVSQLVA